MIYDLPPLQVRDLMAALQGLDPSLPVRAKVDFLEDEPLQTFVVNVSLSCGMPVLEMADEYESAGHWLTR